MNHEWLAAQFEEQRARLRAVAYRMLGSPTEADDAVQEAWLRLSRADTARVDNLGGWLTTVVSRVCLDMLRARKARREEALEVLARDERRDPEEEAVLADSVGFALLVVLETLAPAERVAFVLHDMFDVSFEEIARVVGRTPAAARQLASRARRRVRGAARTPPATLARQREVVDAFVAAARAGDLEALLALLDPDVVLRIDRRLVPRGAPTEIRGAAAVAQRATKGAGGARGAQPALVNGAVGVIVVPRGKLIMALQFTIAGGKIREIDAVGDKDRLAGLTLGVLAP